MSRSRDERPVVSKAAGLVGRRPGQLAAMLAALAAVAVGAWLPAPVAAQQVDEATDSLAEAPTPAIPDNVFFLKGRSYGTDAYAGPFDVIFNKGFATTQWIGQDRNIFSYPFGWGAVAASVTRPGKAIEREGGWAKVFKRHLVPFGGDEIREGQWVPNIFGHMLEGGLAYRRLLEWNRLHGMPFPTLSAVLVTQTAVVINEAYETPVNDPWVQENGTAGAFMDVVVNDPLGMLLLHRDGVARFLAEDLDAHVWPRQASITFPGGRLMNNGEAVIVRPRLWFTDDYRIFFRGGVGAEMGVMIPRDDGLNVSIGAGVQSHQRRLNPVTLIEEAQFGFSAGVWIDREGSLLVGASWDAQTDRRLAIDVFPGVISIAGSTLGAWLHLERDYTPYFGITGRRTLGAGVGLGL